MNSTFFTSFLPSSFSFLLSFVLLFQILRRIGYCEQLNKTRSHFRFLAFSFGAWIYNETEFTILSFLLMALSALGGAASETSAMSIAIEEFPERLGMASVSLFLVFIIKITIKQVIMLVRLSVELTGTHKRRNRRLY